MQGEALTVSVVVTNHDYERYVSTAIDSALAQSHPVVEVVVVDDGSNDRSREIIAGYGDRVTAVFTPNRGQTSAMNAGLAASSGEVVCFLDADDVLSTDAMAAAVRRFADPRVIKVHWPLEEVDCDGRPAGRLWPREALPEGDLLERLLEVGPAGCAFPPTSGNAFRRSFLESMFPLPVLEAAYGIGSASADAYLSMFALASGHVACLDRPLGSYRVHGDNDFAGTELSTSIDRCVRVSDHQIEALARHLAERGIAADVERWRRGSWFHQLRAALDGLAETIPQGRTWVLVDEDVSGLRADGRWAVRPFLERDGEYWGPAACAAEAISELERMRGEGADAIVFTWLSRWWLEAFPELLGHLREHYRLLLETDLLVGFDLASRVAAPGARGGVPACA